MTPEQIAALPPDAEAALADMYGWVFRGPGRILRIHNEETHMHIRVAFQSKGEPGVRPPPWREVSRMVEKTDMVRVEAMEFCMAWQRLKALLIEEGAE